MESNFLRTPVDDLVELVEKNENCSITFLQSKLNVDREFVEKWIVILEEYNVLVSKYTGFEGYVKLVNDDKNKLVESLEIDNLKADFLNKCHNKKIPSDKIELLWKKFIEINLDEIKRLFIENAKIKKYKSYQINLAWNKYKKDLDKL